MPKKGIFGLILVFFGLFDTFAQEGMHAYQSSFIYISKNMTAKDFLSAIPSKINPEEVEGMNSVFHFDFGNNEGYTVTLADGKGEFSEGLNGEAECVVKSSADDFMKIISGDLNPMMAMMMGKIKISNVGVMMKYAKLFGIM